MTGTRKRPSHRLKLEFRRRGITRDRPKGRFFNDRHAEYDILDQSLCACDGLFPLPVEEKAFSGLPQAPQKRPSGFQGAEQLLNLLKPNCFPLDFRELPIPNNPFFAKDLA